MPTQILKKNKIIRANQINYWEKNYLQSPIIIFTVPIAQERIQASRHNATERCYFYINFVTLSWILKEKKGQDHTILIWFIFFDDYQLSTGKYQEKKKEFSKNFDLLHFDWNHKVVQFTIKSTN